MSFVCAPRRVRLANSKAHNALGDISTGAPPSPLTAWPENAPAGTMASSTATQLAQAQREAVRMAWDLSVLKRSLPELEATATSSRRLAEGFQSQQESLAKGRVDGDLALQDARAALQASREECATLRMRNADLEREVAALRRASAVDITDLAPKTPQTRNASGRGLSPLSPLLQGLNENDANRSRGSAYWRRARMCLKIASIADYWQVRQPLALAAHGAVPALDPWLPAPAVPPSSCRPRALTLGFAPLPSPCVPWRRRPRASNPVGRASGRPSRGTCRVWGRRRGAARQGRQPRGVVQGPRRRAWPP